MSDRAYGVCWLCGEAGYGPPPAFAFVCYACDDKIVRNRDFRELEKNMKLVNKDHKQAEDSDGR